MNYKIETLGCKVNQVESAALETLLKARGHAPASPDAACDAVIINSCAVTGDASRQSRQTARRLLREHPGALLAVCGCASQIAPEEMAALGAALIGGSGDRKAFIEELEVLIARGKSLITEGEISAKTIVGNPAKRRIIEPLPSGAPDGRTRAMIKIQDGCDNFCSYCVIPYARGRVRSLPIPDAVAEGKALEAQGFREIVLTGIEISSYGKDLPLVRQDAPSLADVVCAISRAVPSVRLRLGSLEPSMITPEFVDALAAAPNLCEHFHLSLQSGSDDVLRRMRRKYSTAEFYNALSTLRERFPNCGATADLIMGFPGETEHEVQETLYFLEKCAFSRLHVFPYSVRPGTRAAEMPEQILNAEKKARAAMARAVGERTASAFLAAQTGRTLEVLFERKANGVFIGHSRNYVEVGVPATRGEALHGVLKSVAITGVNGGVCVG